MAEEREVRLARLTPAAPGPSVPDPSLLTVEMKYGFWAEDGSAVLGPKLLLPMGYVKLGEKNCVHMPSVGEQIAN